MDLIRSNWLLLALLSAFFAALTTIFAKLGVRDRAQAVAFAYNNGFAEPSPPTG